MAATQKKERAHNNPEQIGAAPTGGAKQRSAAPTCCAKQGSAARTRKVRGGRDDAVAPDPVRFTGGQRRNHRRQKKRRRRRGREPWLALLPCYRIMTEW